MANYIQSFISNVSFPKSLDELKYEFIDNRGQYDVETILYGEPGEWTSPNWAKKDDIVFFMHAKTARSTITSLRTDLKNSRDNYNNESYEEIMQWLTRGLEIHKRYGGKIFAVGRVVGPPKIYAETKDNPEYSHWKSKIYADIGDRWLLNTPIDISEFNSFILVSRQSSITPVFGAEYDSLKSLILSSNRDAPDYFINSIATPLPLSKISSETWLKLSNEYRRSFILEQQFRTYYVNYFLQIVGDKKTFYRECRARKTGYADSFIDNLIVFNKRLLPVEVKLNIDNEPDIIGQVRKYCNDEQIFYDHSIKSPVNMDEMYHNNVLIIDTENIYLYDDSMGNYTSIYSLDSINDISDVLAFKNHLMQLLH